MWRREMKKYPKKRTQMTLELIQTSFGFMNQYLSESVEMLKEI